MSAPPGSTSTVTGFEPFDQLATMVALAAPNGRCLLANSALENVVGVSRRALKRGSVFDWLADPGQLRETLRLVACNEVATSRFDANLKRLPMGSADLPVHVIVSQTEWPERVLVEVRHPRGTRVRRRAAPIPASTARASAATMPNREGARRPSSGGARTSMRR